MQMRWIWIGCFAFLGLLGCHSPEELPKPPNIVFILADDLGWSQLGCYGGAAYRTPNIDQLAAEGIRFTQAYAAAAVCSPTRAAIMSLAFGQPFAVLDGNVERVVTRLCAYDADVRRPETKGVLQALISRLLADHPPGEFNEAFMELGATVCLPRNPDCPDCPLVQVCRAAKQGRQESFPFKSRKKPVPTVRVGAAVTWHPDGRFLIAKRREDQMLGGLWEFPGGKIEAGESVSECIVREMKEELGIGVEVREPLIFVRHTYSHFKLQMEVHHCIWTDGEPAAVECADFRWVTREECDVLPFSKADLKVLDIIMD